MDEEQPKKKPKQVAISLVKASKGSSLVEWEEKDGLHRAYLPSELINESGKVAEDDLDRGLPYGLAWEEIVKLHATPANVAARLRAAGIWTLEDITKNPRVVIGALQAAYSLDLSALIEASRKATQ